MLSSIREDACLLAAMRSTVPLDEWLAIGEMLPPVLDQILPDAGELSYALARYRSNLITDARHKRDAARTDTRPRVVIESDDYGFSMPADEAAGLPKNVNPYFKHAATPHNAIVSPTIRQLVNAIKA